MMVVFLVTKAKKTKKKEKEKTRKIQRKDMY